MFEDFINPLVARVGTAFGGYLVALGVETDQVNVILAGAGAAVAVAIELVLRRWFLRGTR